MDSRIESRAPEPRGRARRSARKAAPEPTSDGAIARLLAIGSLGPLVLHEFANLLTIVDGNQQLLRLGLPPSPPDAVDPAVARCGTLISAFRHVFSGAGFSPVEFDIPLRPELGILELLLRARLKGAATQVACAPIEQGLMLPSARASGIRIGWLTLLLGFVERARDPSPDPKQVELLNVILGAELGATGNVELRARFDYSGSCEALEPGTVGANLVSAGTAALAAVHCVASIEEHGTERRLAAVIA